MTRLPQPELEPASALPAEQTVEQRFDGLVNLLCDALPTFPRERAERILFRALFGVGEEV